MATSFVSFILVVYMLYLFTYVKSCAVYCVLKGWSMVKTSFDTMVWFMVLEFVPSSLTFRVTATKIKILYKLTCR